MGLSFHIANYMTESPHCIEPHLSLAEAKRRMIAHRIRHLPVRSGGKIVGILSERDLTFALRYISDSKPVSEVMIFDPYCIIRTELVQGVAGTMADRGIGSAIIVNDKGEVEGIFTYIDALKALAEIAANGQACHK